MSARNCNILKGMCILQQSVEDHLNSRDYFDAQLQSVVPPEHRFNIENGAYSLPNESSGILITMKRGPVSFTKLAPYGGDPDSVRTTVLSQLIFNVSTNNYITTELLSVEIGAWLSAVTKDIREYITVGTVAVDPTQLQRKESPNYYYSTVTVGVSLPQITWQLNSLVSILRDIDIHINLK